MQTIKWGPAYWFSLHITAHGAPEHPTPQQKKYYKDFYYGLQHTLPCKYCRASYSKFIKQLPIDPYLVSRRRLAYWVYLMHNKVNAKLRRQGYEIDPNPKFSDVCTYYEQYRAKCSTKVMSCRTREKKEKQTEFTIRITPRPNKLVKKKPKKPKKSKKKKE